MEEIQTDYGIFTSNELTGQTAEEVYQNYLESKDKPVEPQLTELVKLKIAQAEQFEYLLEILERMM